MTILDDSPAYESCREWALQPWLPRPPGVVHLLRGGIMTWVRQRPRHQSPAVSAAVVPAAACPSASPLLTVVAAMIAQVCR